VFGRGRVRCFMSSFKVNFRFDRLVQVKPSTYWLLVQKSTEIVGEGGNGNRNRCKAVFLRSLTTSLCRLQSEATSVVRGVVCFRLAWTYQVQVPCQKARPPNDVPCTVVPL
jgi:hypothetical protein